MQLTSLPLSARIEPLPALQELRHLWQSIAVSGGNSFFTSWDWIESWLLELRTDGEYRLLRVSRGEVTVAIAILVFAEVRRPNRLVRRVVHLHATGDTECDSIHIEQNALLTNGSAAREVYGAALDCLLDCGQHWDEIDLQGVVGHQWWLDAAKRYNLLIELETQPAPRIAFDELGVGKQLWQVASDKKDRYALRRALADYSRLLGALCVTEPSNLEEALTFFDAMSGLHQQRWQPQGVSSQFLLPRPQRFHKRLVAAGFANRSVRICRVMAGSSTVGYVYLLIHNGMANYYQSGFDYGLLQRQNQPGWLCLQLVIERMRREGMTSFEFLGGNEAYKRRLATTMGTRSWLKLTRPLPKYWLERAAVLVVRSLRKAHRSMARSLVAKVSGADPQTTRRST